MSILQKQLEVYLLFEMSLKNGCNNFYFHPYTFDERYKSISYLMSLFRRGPVNSSSPTFGNINFTEAMTNLIVVWKFHQNGCKNLYLHPNPFKSSSKSSSYRTSISRCCPVAASSHTFPNINLRKTMGNLPIVWKITEKRQQ